MAVTDVTLNYSLTSDKGLEGHFDPLPGLYIAGTSEGLFNVDSAALPFGRVITYKGSTAGGVGLPSATNQSVAGFSFYQASYERNAQFSGDAGTPYQYPAEVIRKGALLYIVPEENLAVTDTLYFRCILNATLGTYEALGRIRNDADNITISNVALTSDVATITATGHGLTVGQVVTIAGLTTTALNGTYTVASTPTANTFTFAKINANINSTSDSGTIARCAVLSNVRLIEAATAGQVAKLAIDLPY